MLGQMNIFGKTKLEQTIDRIKQFEPQEGYYLAFSGGKDSQCVYHLCKMAGVNFDAHYSVTSVDPPELVQFIKAQYPDVSRDVPKDKEGKPVTMWSLISSNKIPPTRVARYCCEKLKESSGKGRITMTGVRWSESANRAKNQDGIAVFDKGKSTRKMLSENGVTFRETNKKGVILNFDDSTTRRGAELCYRTRKTLINPIIDWEEDEVWEFLNDIAKVPHCKLYDEGLTRLGCIGCPMQGAKGMRRDFERYPTYKRAYLRAFEKMLKNHGDSSIWKTAQDVFEWWVSG